MEHLANIALGLGVTGTGFLAAVTLDEKSYIPLGIVAGIVLVIWRISGSWVKMTDQLHRVEATLSKLIEVMKSRPCIRKGECEFIAELENIKEKEET